MANKSSNLKAGVGALFGEVQPESVQQHEVHGSQGYLAGRRRNDDTRMDSPEDDERTTLVLNKHQYAVIRTIARQEQVTIKSLVTEMFRIGIELYERKHGPVEVHSEKDPKEIF